MPRKPAPKTDAVLTEIVRNGVLAVTEEMKTNLMRTAYNMIIYEALDFTVGLFTAEGETVSIGIGLPSFIRGMSNTVKAKLAAFGEDLHPDDILVTNDAYITGSHLNHFTFSQPIFVRGLTIRIVVAWAGLLIALVRMHVHQNRLLFHTVGTTVKTRLVSVRQRRTAVVTDRRAHISFASHLSISMRHDSNNDFSTVDRRSLPRIKMHDLTVVVVRTAMCKGIQKSLLRVIHVAAATIRRVKVDENFQCAGQRSHPAGREDRAYCDAECPTPATDERPCSHPPPVVIG